jgi:hypothetical protein
MTSSDFSAAAIAIDPTQPAGYRRVKPRPFPPGEQNAAADPDKGGPHAIAPK